MKEVLVAKNKPLNGININRNELIKMNIINLYKLLFKLLNEIFEKLNTFLILLRINIS